jgi:hypothetical protein
MGNYVTAGVGNYVIVSRSNLGNYVIVDTCFRRPCWSFAGVRSGQDTRSDSGVRCVKGDRVEIVIDVGGSTRSYDVAATRAGRRVEIATRRGLVEVTEVTRTGTPVRTARFMASRIISLVEYPAGEHDPLG